LKYYKQSFVIPDLLVEGKGIYINFERDTVYFGNRGDFYGLLASTRLGVVIGLEKVRNLAVRGLKWGDVGKWDFDVLKELEDVVLMAQDGGKRRFDLRREPTLVRGEPNACFERGMFEMPSRMGNVMRAFEDFCYARGEKVEGWTPPTVRFGMFVKWKSDSWFVRSGGF
jgi:hypothetical protein